MATVLYFRDTTSNAIGTYKDAITTIGASAVTGVVNTEAGGANILWTESAGGSTYLEWISGRIPAGGVANIGTMSYSVYASEGDIAANCTVAFIVYRREPDGTLTVIDLTEDNAELTASLTTARTWSGTPTVTAFNEDDRIVFRLVLENFGTMGGGETCSFRYNAAGTAGESKVTLGTTIAFKSDAVDTAADSTDTIVIADSGDAFAGRVSASTDTIVIADVTSVLAQYIADSTDTIVIADVTSVLAQYIAANTDAIDISDLTDVLAQRIADSTDTIVISDDTDAVVESTGIYGDVLDTIDISDTTDAVYNFGAILDTVDISDTTDATYNFGAILDTVDISDVTDAARGHLASVTDTIIIADITDALRDAISNSTDTIVISDLTSALKSSISDITDTIIVTDVFSALGIYLGITLDTITVTDTFSATSSRVVLPPNNTVDRQISFITSGVGLSYSGMEHLMPIRLSLPSFAAGELSPLLWGRVDLAKYAVGLATCLNWNILPQGGAMTRPGSSIVGEVFDSAVRSRLFRFQFRSAPSGQNYILEFAHQKMRVIMDGGYVLDTSNAITGITRATSAVINIPGHALSVGDDIYINGVLGMTQMNNRKVRITVSVANFVTVDINSTNYEVYTSGGTAGRYYTITSPYAASDLHLLKSVQSQDVMTMTHPSYPVYRLTRTGHSAWTFTVVTFTSNVPAPTGITNTNPGSVRGYVVTAVDDITGEEGPISAQTTAADTISRVNWDAVAGATYYNVYATTNGIFGFVGRATQPAGFTDTSIIPDSSDSPPFDRNPFNSADNYPGTAMYHGGRLWFARTNNMPQTLWASGSANINSMAVSTPTRDNDAITRTIASREINEIRHMVSMSVLVIFTSGAEWKGDAGDGTNIITPGSFSVRQQGSTGSSHSMIPIIIRNSIVYVASSERRIMDMEYQFGADNWSSRDISILSSHLLENYDLVEWAYAKDPDSVIWASRDDGAVLSLTYLKDQDVYAWSRHSTQGLYESFSSIQEGSETATYFTVQRTVGGVTKRYVERMQTRNISSVYDAWCVDSGVKFDGKNYNAVQTLKISGATYDTGDIVSVLAAGFTPFLASSVGTRWIMRDEGTQSQITFTIISVTDTTHAEATLDYSPHIAFQNVATSNWGRAITSMGGLWHLEGNVPAILADGAVIEPGGNTILNGAYELPYPAMQVVVGLGYECDLETLNIDDPGPTTIQGKLKIVSDVVIGVKQTRGLSVGPTFDQLTDIKERRSENFGYPTMLKTGQEKIKIQNKWNSNGRICVRQAYPLPAILTGIFPNLDVGE